MKILMIISRIPSPPDDGGAIYVYNITKYMANRGHKLVMASFISNRHRQKPELLVPYCKLYSAPAHFKSYNIPSVIKSTLTRQPISIQHRMDIPLMDHIISQIPDTNFDLISIEGIHSAQFLNIIKKRYPDKPIILRQANVENLLLERNARKATNPLIRWFLLDQARLMKKFEYQAMLNVDGVTAVTSVDREKFIKMLPDLNCEVVEDGAKLPDLRGIIRDERTLLSISNWKWRPNIEGLKWFVKFVWPVLHKNHPNLHFEIAGHGIPNRFQKKLESLGITCLGFVKDVEYYRQKATIMMVPLLSGSGLKLKILEGLASGIPIITTSIGAEGIAMRPDKDYLLAETPGDFIKQTEKLLNDHELQQKLSVNGRTLIKQKYQWDKKAEILENFMVDILNKQRS